MPDRHINVTPREPGAEPICLLTPEWAVQRREAVDTLLAEAVAEMPLPNGIEYRFEATPTIWPRIETFIAEEGECCPFLAFEAFESERDTVLRIVQPQPEA
jgi:hypothetical protein